MCTITDENLVKRLGWTVVPAKKNKWESLSNMGATPELNLLHLPYPTTPTIW